MIRLTYGESKVIQVDTLIKFMDYLILVMLMYEDRFFPCIIDLLIIFIRSIIVQSSFAKVIRQISIKNLTITSGQMFTSYLKSPKVTTRREEILV